MVADIRPDPDGVYRPRGPRRPPWEAIGLVMYVLWGVFIVVAVGNADTIAGRAVGC